MQFWSVLNEVCRASVVKATGALSKFIRTPIIMSIAITNIKNENINEYVSLTSKKCVGFYFPFKGDISGSALFICPESSAMLFYDGILTNENKIKTAVSKDELAFLSELANIFIDSFMESFYRSLRIEYLNSNIAISDNGYMDKILNNVILTNYQEEEKMMVNVQLNIDNSLLGNAFFILNQESIHSVLQKFIFDERTY